MEVESEKYLIQIDSVADPTEGAPGDAAGQAAAPSPSLHEEPPPAAAPWASAAPGRMRAPGVGLRRRPPGTRFTPPVPSAERPVVAASAAAATTPAWQPPLVAAALAPAPARSASEILSLLTGAAAPPTPAFPPSDAPAGTAPLDAHVWDRELPAAPAAPTPRPPAQPLRRVGPLSRMRPVLRPGPAAGDAAVSAKENQAPTPLRRPYSTVSAAVEDDESGGDDDDGSSRGKRMAEMHLTTRFLGGRSAPKILIYATSRGRACYTGKLPRWVQRKLEQRRAQRGDGDLDEDDFSALDDGWDTPASRGGGGGSSRGHGFASARFAQRAPARGRDGRGPRPGEGASAPLGGGLALLPPLDFPTEAAAAQIKGRLRRRAQLPTTFETVAAYQAAFRAAVQECLQVEVTELALRFWHLRRESEGRHAVGSAEEERFLRSKGINAYFGCSLQYARVLRAAAVRPICDWR